MSGPERPAPRSIRRQPRYSVPAACEIVATVSKWASAARFFPKAPAIPGATVSAVVSGTQSKPMADVVLPENSASAPSRAVRRASMASSGSTTCERHGHDQRRPGGPAGLLAGAGERALAQLRPQLVQPVEARPPAGEDDVPFGRPAADRLTGHPLDTGRQAGARGVVHVDDGGALHHAHAAAAQEAGRGPR